MAHTECHDVGSWVESTIQQQVEQCIEQDCDWWCACCNKWLCALAWVVVNIVTWVVQTVCEVVLDTVDLIRNLLRGTWDFLAGVFTGDWTRALAGLGEIVGGVVAAIFQIGSIATGGTLVGTFATSISAWKLRNYARGLLEAKYASKDPEGYQKMVDALGLESGGFGLRLKVTALRMFLRSDFSSQPDGTPDLYAWVRDNHLDLKVLAGFNPPLAWWRRPWPELVGDSGDVQDYDIDTYIINKGVGDLVKHFSLYCMSTDDMQTRLDCAVQHAPEIGLILQTSIEDKRIESFDQITVLRATVPFLLQESPFSRHKYDVNSPSDSAAAIAELCQPLVIGVFRFTEDNAMGQSAHLADATCLEAGPHGTDFGGEGITGTTFRVAKPDLAFKYTAIHELGHTFGLCHVDNVLRIMWTHTDDEPKNYTTWPGTPWQWWTSGTEASFILDEGKKVWDYIVANFSAECLETRQF